MNNNMGALGLGPLGNILGQGIGQTPLTPGTWFHFPQGVSASVGGPTAPIGPPQTNYIKTTSKPQGNDGTLSFEIYSIEFSYEESSIDESKLLLLQKIVERWCDENCEGVWIDDMDTFSGEMLFELEQDAMAFKLRWL